MLGVLQPPTPEGKESEQELRIQGPTLLVRTRAQGWGLGFQGGIGGLLLGVDQVKTNVKVHLMPG